MDMLPGQRNYNVRINDGDMNMQLRTTSELWQKGAWCVARIPELDFVAQGRTIEEVKANLIEVVGIQFAEMKEMGTLDDYLTECGFEMKDDIVNPLNEMIGFEKQILQVA